MSDSTCERSYGIRLSLSDLLHLVWSFLGPPGCCQGPHFILFYGHCEHVQHLYPVIGGPPGFSTSCLENTAAAYIGVHGSSQIMVLSGYIPGNGVAGSSGSFIFRFLRSRHTMFHSGCTSAHSHQQWRRALFSASSPAFVSCRFFNDGCSDHCEVVAAAVQSLSRVRLFVTPRTAARPASQASTISRSWLKLMSIESVMPINHLILCRPLLLPPSIFPSIRVFSSESALSNQVAKALELQLSI